MDQRPARRALVGEYRFGFVLLMALTVLVFFVLAPEGRASRTIGLVLMVAMLVVVLATSGEAHRGHPALAIALGLIGVGLVICVATGAFSRGIAVTGGAVAGFATVPALVTGLARMLRERGVTMQAIFGGVAIYVVLGLCFAYLSVALAGATDGFYFAQTREGTISQHVYFTFTTVATTGYGDLTPATRPGRAISVLEMLVGQIYLVTVVGILVGNLRRRTRAEVAG